MNKILNIIINKVQRVLYVRLPKPVKVLAVGLATVGLVGGASLPKIQVNQAPARVVQVSWVDVSFTPTVAAQAVVVSNLTSSAGVAVQPILNDAASVVNTGISGAEAVWLTLAGMACLGAIIGFLRRRKS